MNEDLLQQYQAILKEHEDYQDSEGRMTWVERSHFFQVMAEKLLVILAQIKKEQLNENI